MKLKIQIAGQNLKLAASPKIITTQFLKALILKHHHLAYYISKIFETSEFFQYIGRFARLQSFMENTFFTFVKDYGVFSSCQFFITIWILNTYVLNFIIRLIIYVPPSPCIIEQYIMHKNSLHRVLLKVL